MKNPPPTPEQLERAKTLLRAGRTWASVATEVGRSEYSLRQHIPKNIKPRKTCRVAGCNRYVVQSAVSCPTHDDGARRERQRLDREAKIRRIVELRERGMHVRDIAASISLSPTWVSHLMQDPAYEEIRQQYLDSIEEELALLDGRWVPSPANPLVLVWDDAA